VPPTLAQATPAALSGSASAPPAPPSQVQAPPAGPSGSSPLRASAAAAVNVPAGSAALYTIPRPSTQSRGPLHNPVALYTIPLPSPLSFGPCHHHAAQAAIFFFYSAALRPSLEGGNVAAENVRASREKSGNQQLGNLPTCYYKYVYVILCIQSCPILRGINILSSTIS
jgi:hypothetical protein